MALTLIILISIHLLSIQHLAVLAGSLVQTSNYGQSSASASAAIVRRLYHSGAGQSGQFRTNPYRSIGQSGPILPKGIAQVTPISLQSTSFADSNIRLTNRPFVRQSPVNQTKNDEGFLQKPSTTMIKVIGIANNDTLSRQLANNDLNNTTNTTATTISSFSSRQGKLVPLSVPRSTKIPSPLNNNSFQSSLSSLPTSSSSSPSSSSFSSSSSQESTLENLCFLSHGGSSETFTVNEAMPVNSVIGTIKVIISPLIPLISSFHFDSNFHLTNPNTSGYFFSL